MAVSEDNEYSMFPPQTAPQKTHQPSQISGKAADAPSSEAVSTPSKSADPKPESSPSHLRRSVAIPISHAAGLHSLSTVQFLERSRRDLELSVAMPVPASASAASTTTSSSASISSNPTSSGNPLNPVSTPPVSSQPLATAVIEPPASQQQQQPRNTPKDDEEQQQRPKETMQERLKRRIALFGLEEHKQVPGDGNCQFYSLSDQLYNDFMHAHIIRAYAVNWLRNHGDMKLENGAQLKEFGHDDEGWDHYCNLMSLSGTWGDHLTLVAVAELFQVRIVIVSSAVDESQALIEVVPTSTGKDPEQLPVIFLCHYAEYHYGTLRQIQED